jgi:hypothetical protein
VLAAVATVFPAKVSQYVAGPILELGWGRPLSIVTMTAGAVFTFPNPVAVVIIGEFRIAVPEPDAPVIDLRASFAGIIDLSTGDVSFDASLARSRIGTFDVAGDIALRGGSESFVFTAGGFNPLFTPPRGLTSVRRLSISVSPSTALNIHAECYFAITASSLQFGAAMYVEAELGPIRAKGHVSLDTLIRPSRSCISSRRSPASLISRWEVRRSPLRPSTSCSRVRALARAPTRASVCSSSAFREPWISNGERTSCRARSARRRRAEGARRACGRCCLAARPSRRGRRDRAAAFLGWMPCTRLGSSA